MVSMAMVSAAVFFTAMVSSLMASTGTGVVSSLMASTGTGVVSTVVISSYRVRTVMLFIVIVSFMTVVTGTTQPVVSGSCCDVCCSGLWSPSICTSVILSCLVSVQHSWWSQTVMVGCTCLLGYYLCI